MKRKILSVLAIALVLAVSLSVFMITASAADVAGHIALRCSYDLPADGTDVFYNADDPITISSIDQGEISVEAISKLDIAEWAVADTYSEEYSNYTTMSGVDCFESGKCYALKLRLQHTSNRGIVGENTRVSMTFKGGEVKEGQVVISNAFLTTVYFYFNLIPEPELSEISSIEFAYDGALPPVAGAEVKKLDVVSVDGDPALVAPFMSAIDFYEAWCYSLEEGTDSFDYLYYAADTFLGGYYYMLYAECEADSESGVTFADKVTFTITHTDGTYTGTIDPYNSKAFDFNYMFAKSEGEPLITPESIDITLEGYEIGADIGDLTVNVDGEGVEVVDFKLLDCDGNPISITEITAGSYSIDILLAEKDGYSLMAYDYISGEFYLTFNGMNAVASYDDEHKQLSVSADLHSLREGVDYVYDTIEAYLAGFVAGRKPGYVDVTLVNDGVYCSTNYYDDEYYFFYCDENGDYVFLESDDVFVPGVEYYLSCYLEVEPYVSLANITMDSIMINGNTVDYAYLDIGSDIDGNIYDVISIHTKVGKPLEITEDKIVINSVELVYDGMLPPLAGDPLKGATIVSVNGDPDLANYLNGTAHWGVDWYYSMYKGQYDQYVEYYRDEFIGGYYYNLFMWYHLDDEEYLVSGDSITYTIIYDGGVFSGECYVDVEYDEYYFSVDHYFEKTAGETPKSPEKIEITIDGYEIGASVDDLTVTFDGEGSILEGYEIYDTYGNSLSGTSFEAGLMYWIRATFASADGYNVLGLLGNDSAVTVNGWTVYDIYYDSECDKLYIEAYLPILNEGADPLDRIELGVDGYELGAKAEDATIILPEGIVDMESYYYDDDYWFYYIDETGEIIYVDDDAFEVGITYYLRVAFFVNNAYSLHGMDYTDVKVNGITPEYAYIYEYLDDDDNLYSKISLTVKLEPFYDHEHGYSTVKHNADGHWSECFCGHATAIEPHADLGGDDNCDTCGRYVGAPRYVYDVYLNLGGYVIGGKVGDITVAPIGLGYTVHSITVYKNVDGSRVLCTPEELIAAGTDYRIVVVLEAEVGYVIYANFLTANLAGVSAVDNVEGNTYTFDMPALSSSTAPYPTGEIKLGNFYQGMVASSVTVEMPEGYPTGLVYAHHFMIIKATDWMPVDAFADDSYLFAVLVQWNSAYDAMSIVENPPTLFGVKPAYISYAGEMGYQLTYSLPIPPKMNDIMVDSIEFILQGYELGKNTEEVKAIISSVGCVIDASWIVQSITDLSDYITPIIAGNKYYLAVSISAQDGYSLAGITSANVTLDGKAPVDAFWEEGFYVAVFELDAIPDPTAPVGDGAKDGLGAGAIVAIVLGSVLVVGIGGFAVFWFVIKKNSFGALIEAIGSFFNKIFSIFKKQ